MNTEMLFNLIMVGGIAGFAAYCGSYAFHVWRARNASSGAKAGGRGLRWAVPFVLGLALIAGSYLVLHAQDRSGVLAADGIFTVRVPEKLGVKELTSRDAVVAGAVIARFHSPEREAQARALSLKLDALAAEKRIAERQPLPLDAELVRTHQDLVNERRHLEASRDQLLPARDVVDRDRLREGAAKRDQLKTLTAEIDRFHDEVEQAAAKRELAEAQLARVTKSAATRAATGDELAIKQSELKVLEKEVQKLTGQLTHAKEQRKQVEEDLARLEDLSEAQAVVLNRHIDRLRTRLAELPAEEAPLKERLAEELAGAETRRKARLEQIDVELAQCRAELAGAEGALAVTAPFSGRIAFREQAPRNAPKDAPVLVLAPDDAFRLRLRLPGSEIASLRRAGAVVLELENPGVERRFEGRLLATRPLALDGGNVLAELACTPPADAVRDLGNTKPVAVRLRWVPPVYVTPLFWVGAALAATGALSAALSAVPAFLRRRTVGAGESLVKSNWAANATPLPHSAPAPSFAIPLHAAVLAGGPVAGATDVAAVASPTETGAAGPMLRLLGLQLREAVLRGTLELSILAAVEWSLDRHHGRAVKALSQALGDDEELVRRIAAIDVEKIASPSESLERLLRILRAVGGPRLRHCIRTLDQRADAHLRQAHGLPAQGAPATPAATKAAGSGGAEANGQRKASGNANAAHAATAHAATSAAAEVV